MPDTRATAGSLPAAAITRYQRDGYLCPLPVLSAEEVARYRAAYDAYEQANTERLAHTPPAVQQAVFSETHVSLPWVHELATRPAVLDAVASLLGPDLLIWNTRWFAKQAKSKTYITWHQDAFYWGLEPPLVATAWVALSPSHDGNGCLRVVPGSHRGALLPHEDTFAPDNALSRGQEIAVQVDEAAAHSLVLQPGEMSIHDVGIVHGSKPNTSDEPRIGLAIRYVASEVHQHGSRVRATLVRGEDRHGHFDLLPAPRDEEPDAVRETRRVDMIEALARNLMPNTGGTPTATPPATAPRSDER